MNEAIETREVNGYRVELHYDEDGAAADPRDWSNVGSLVYRSRDYARDEVGISRDYWTEYGMEELRERLMTHHGAIEQFIIAISFADDAHGPGTFSFSFLTDFDDIERAIGFYFTTSESLKEMGFDAIDDHDRIFAAMHAELDIYAQWARGEVYGYTVTNPHTDEVVESCWGYVGDDDALNEGVNVAEGLDNAVGAMSQAQQRRLHDLVREAAYLSDEDHCDIERSEYFRGMVELIAYSTGRTSDHLEEIADAINKARRAS